MATHFPLTDIRQTIDGTSSTLTDSVTLTGLVSDDSVITFHWTADDEL